MKALRSAPLLHKVTLGWGSWVAHSTYVWAGSCYQNWKRTTCEIGQWLLHVRRKAPLEHQPMTPIISYIVLLIKNILIAPGQCLVLQVEGFPIVGARGTSELDSSGWNQTCTWSSLHVIQKKYFTCVTRHVPLSFLCESKRYLSPVWLPIPEEGVLFIVNAKTGRLFPCTFTKEERKEA